MFICIYLVGIQMFVNTTVAEIRSPEAASHGENECNEYAGLSTDLIECIQEALRLAAVARLLLRYLHFGCYDFHTLQVVHVDAAGILSPLLPVYLVNGSFTQHGILRLLGLCSSCPPLRAEVGDLLFRIVEVHTSAPIAVGGPHFSGRRMHVLPVLYG